MWLRMYLWHIKKFDFKHILVIFPWTACHHRWMSVQLPNVHAVLKHTHTPKKLKFWQILTNIWSNQNRYDTRWKVLVTLKCSRMSLGKNTNMFDCHIQMHLKMMIYEVFIVFLAEVSWWHEIIILLGISSFALCLQCDWYICKGAFVKQCTKHVLQSW